MDWGDLSVARYGPGALSSATRGVCGGGNDDGLNTMDTFSLQSLGNAVDFGDMTQTKKFRSGASSLLRGVFAGGGSTAVNVIDYITIASAGAGTDFGDLTSARYVMGSTSNGHGGLDIQDPNVRFAPTPGVW